MHKLSRLLTLVRFLVENYYRRTHLILEGSLTAIFAGIVFDRSFKPYTYDNVIIGKCIFLILISVIISFRISRTQYAGELSVILSRVSRRVFYIASVLSSAVLTLLLSVAFDLYLVSLVDVHWYTLFGWPTLGVTFLLLVLSIGIIHFSSIYVVKDQFFRVLIPVLLLLGSIPRWYTGLPLEDAFEFISYILPPTGQLIATLADAQISYLHFGYPLVYGILVLLAGIWYFQKRSLSDLAY